MTKSDKHDWVNGVAPDDIRDMIQRAFSFLVSDYSFQEPTDYSINTMVIGLSYSGKHLAIEPLVDRKDCFVETCIVRLTNGSRPEGWKIDKDGNQFMTRLFEAAWDRKVERPEVSNSPDSPYEALQSLLNAEVEILRENFPDFLADDDQYFDDLSRRRASKEAADTQKSFFEKAEELFRAKQYSTLADYLGSTEYKLSKLWKARLVYAKKKA